MLGEKRTPAPESQSYLEVLLTGTILVNFFFAKTLSQRLSKYNKILLEDIKSIHSMFH